MDIYRAIKTMRAVRQYTDQSVGEEIVTRILEAGRWSGSSKNTQPWQFTLALAGTQVPGSSSRIARR